MWYLSSEIKAVSDFDCPTWNYQYAWVTLVDSEQPGNSEPFPVKNLPVYLMNSEQHGVSEQFCDEQKVPYLQVWLYFVLVQPCNNYWGWIIQTKFSILT